MEEMKPEFDQYSDGESSVTSGSDAYKLLSDGEKDRYRRIISELMKFAQEHTIPLCFAPPLVSATMPNGSVVRIPKTLGKIDGASGCVLRLDSGLFFVTAEHVLASYERRIASGECLNFQIGKLSPVEPLGKIAWRDKTERCSLMPFRPTDIVFLRLDEYEARQACDAARILPTPVRWPPVRLSPGQLVVLAGYPNEISTVDINGTILRQAGGMAFQVTSVGDGYCKCRFPYEDLIDFRQATKRPDLRSMNLGGMSGCPAFVLAASDGHERLQFPQLAGIFSQRCDIDPTGEIIEIATLDHFQEMDLKKLGD